MAIARVANRVQQGGHNIPEADIRRRYNSGRRNCVRSFVSIADVWRVYDATEMPPRLVANGRGGSVQVRRPESYEQFRRDEVGND